MKSLNLSAFIFVVFSMLFSTMVSANKDALARAQYMIRQMNAELNQLKSSNHKIKDENLTLISEQKKLQKKYDKLSGKSKKNKSAMSGRLLEVKRMFKEEREAHNLTRKKLHEARAIKAEMTGVASEQTKKIDLCMVNNKKLYDVNKELLALYEDKSVWDSMSQAEPFSQLTKVEIENLVDDYQYKLDDLRVDADL